MQYDDIRPVYYLRKWQYYEAARHELSVTEQEQAKVFFNALKQLNEKERQILSDVYYCSRKPCTFKEKTGYYHSLIPVKDEVLAKKYAVTIDRFSNMRRLAQMSLKKEMQNILSKITSSFMFRINTNLHLVDFINQNTTNETQYILGTKQDGKVFNQNEDIHGLFFDLMLLGFEKVPVK
ncbi:hypothetical protein BH747_04055 [Enterococcus villorum]|uniref:Uncharacterized protein n=1 Tax=Enterococcus villorum TaxID=112904 RepID=A0A1V8YQV0_9ENTE|nr:hypothetical protein [Enterococcus villorum]OQO71170.1 hypothetical protein BH747_04055 [Enterococcus villorum]OQO75000.1 hypothetical protein BH744_06355 [Enterococcus villorum]